MRCQVLPKQSHPVFNHHCQECHYLGSIKDAAEIYDCYFCTKGGASYLGRFSSARECYVSLPVSMIDTLSCFEPYRTIISLHQTK
jgi:hypothetical protein